MWQPAVTAERSLSKLTLSNELESWDFIEQFIYDTDVFRPTLIISSDIKYLLCEQFNSKFLLTGCFQQKRKLRIFISNTFNPAKPDAEDGEGTVASWELRVEGRLLEDVSVTISYVGEII